MMKRAFLSSPAVVGSALGVANSSPIEMISILDESIQ